MVLQDSGRDPKYKSVNRRNRESHVPGHRLVVANEGEEDALAIQDEAPLMDVVVLNCTS